EHHFRDLAVHSGLDRYRVEGLNRAETADQDWNVFGLCSRSRNWDRGRRMERRSRRPLRAPAGSGVMPEGKRTHGHGGREPAEQEYPSTRPRLRLSLERFLHESAKPECWALVPWREGEISI